MAIFERDNTVQAPIEKVFDYITNPANRVEWLHRVTEVRNITGKGKGQKWDYTYKMPGKTINGAVEVTEYQANKLYAHKSSQGFARNWTYNFRSEGDSTHLHIIVEMISFNIPLIGKIIEKRMLRQSKHEADQAINNIKAKLE